MNFINYSEETLCVNLGCGDTFIKSNNWLNFDFKKKQDVTKANLLKKIPLNSNYADVVYCSHFLEHIPEKKVQAFLIECGRILKNKGILRLVLPDFKKMVEEYLFQRNSANNKKSNFMMTSIIDQFVRTEPGGNLQKIFEEVEKNDDQDLKEYIYQRTGYDFKNSNIKSLNLLKGNSLQEKIKNNIFKKYCILISNFLPKIFKDQNLSFADIGEKHTWIYDKYSLEQLLHSSGFKNVREVTESYSMIKNFPFKNLDVNEDNVPKKGFDSIFIEAVKDN